jgi:DNA-binding NarL/FixJ family response regulator
MFCNQCGNKLSNGSRFCDGCGRKLIDNNVITNTERDITTNHPLKPILIFRPAQSTEGHKLLSKEQILDIPMFIEQGLKVKEIAEGYHVHERTINHWIYRLRVEGIEVHTKKGRPKMKLK